MRTSLSETSVYLSLLYNNKVIIGEEAGALRLKVTHVLLHITKTSIHLFFDFLHHSTDLNLILVVSARSNIRSAELEQLKWAHNKHPRITCIFLKPDHCVDHILCNALIELSRSSVFLSNTEYGYLLDALGLVHFQADRIEILEAINQGTYLPEAIPEVIRLGLTGKMLSSVSLRDCAYFIYLHIRTIAAEQPHVVFECYDAEGIHSTLDCVTLNFYCKYFLSKDHLVACIFWANKISNIEPDISLDSAEIPIFMHFDGQTRAYEHIDKVRIEGKHRSFIYEPSCNSDFFKMVGLIQSTSYFYFKKNNLITSWYIPLDLTQRIQRALPSFFERCARLGIRVTSKMHSSKTSDFTSNWNDLKKTKKDFKMSSPMIMLNALSSDKDLEEVSKYLPNKRSLREIELLIMQVQDPSPAPLKTDCKITDAELYPHRVTVHTLALAEPIQFWGGAMKVKYLPPLSKKVPAKQPDAIFKRSVDSVDSYLARSNIKIIIAGSYDFEIYQDLVIRGILPLRYSLQKLPCDSSEIKHVSLDMSKISKDYKVAAKIMLVNGKSVRFYPTIYLQSHKHVLRFIA